MPSIKKNGSFNKQREIEKKRRKKRKIKLIVCVLIAIILGVTMYFLKSPTFKIKNIEITGNSQLDNNKIIEQSGIELGKSMFTSFNIVTKVKIKQKYKEQNLSTSYKISYNKIKKCW